MTVRVSKPKFNLREKLSELDKPSGVKGNELLRSNTIQEARDLIGAGRKNLIINGNFDVWQRGTSFSSLNSMQYTADRWLQYAAGSSTVTATQQPFTVGQTEVPGNPKYYYRMDNTPDPNTAWLELFYRIEDVRRFSDVPVTLSFWLRTNKFQSGEDEIRITQNFGTSGNGASSAVTLRSPIFDVQTYWKKYELTFDLPSVAGKTIVDNSFLQIHLLRATNAVAADTYYDLAQFQLEYGRAATPFEQRSYGEELALCQRYFFRMKPNNSYSAYGMGGAYSSTQAVALMHFPVPMRKIPDFSYNGNLNQFYDKVGGGSSFSSIAVTQVMGNTTTGIPHLELLVLGTFTAGNPFILSTYNNTSTHLNFDAELPDTYSP